MEWIGRTWRVKIGSFEPRLSEKPPVVPRAMSYREPVIFTTVRSWTPRYRRINTAYRPDDGSYLSISSPRVKTCTLQLKCRGIRSWNNAATDWMVWRKRRDVFVEKEIESGILAEWNSVLFLKNLSRFVENRECGSVVVRIYVWKKEIIHPRVLSTNGVYNNGLEDKKQDK